MTRNINVIIKIVVQFSRDTVEIKMHIINFMLSYNNLSSRILRSFDSMLTSCMIILHLFIAVRPDPLPDAAPDSPDMFDTSGIYLFLLDLILNRNDQNCF